MTSTQSTIRSGRGTVKLAVVLHAALGFLLMALDFVVRVLPSDMIDIGRLLSLEPLYPLLPCCGLFWVLIAAGLMGRRDKTFATALVAHGVMIVLSVVFLGSAVLLLWPDTSGHRGHGAGMDAPVVVYLVALAIVLLSSSSSLAAVLYRIRDSLIETPIFQSKQAKLLVAAGGAAFLLNIGFVWQYDRAEAMRRDQIERTVAHARMINALEFSPDGSQLASASSLPLSDEWIRIWDVNTGQLVRQLRCGRPVAELVWSNDGQWLVAACGEMPGNEHNGSVMFWRTADWSLANESLTSYVRSAAVSQDSQFVAAGVSVHRHGVGQAVVMLYHLPTFDVIGFGDVHLKTVKALAFSRDGRRLVAAGGSEIAVWDLLFRNDTPPAAALEVDGRITDLARVVDEFIYATSPTGELRSVNVSPLNAVDRRVSFQLGHLPANAPMLAVAGDKVVVADPQWQQVTCLRWPSGDQLFSLALSNYPTAVAISKAGDVVAIGVDRRIMLYEAEEGTFLRELIRTP